MFDWPELCGFFRKGSVVRSSIVSFEKTKIPVKLPYINPAQHTLKIYKLSKISNSIDYMWSRLIDHGNDFSINIGHKKILMVSSGLAVSQTIASPFPNHRVDTEGAGGQIADDITTGALFNHLGDDSSL